MAEETQDNEVASLQAIIGALLPLSQDVRQRLLQTVGTFFKIDRPFSHISVSASPSNDLPSTATIKSGGGFSNHSDLSPKQFILEKQPRTDVERVACLAYYLTNFRGAQFFKTVDISLLNMEAACPKFANAAYSVNNSLKMGYLAPASKGQKQLSGGGEQFVQALPNRDAAAEVLKRMKPRKRKSSPDREITASDMDETSDEVDEEAELHASR